MSDCTAWCNPLIQIARDKMTSVPGFFYSLVSIGGLPVLRTSYPYPVLRCT